MGTIVLIFLTAFAAVICGAVLLIQMGGWLPVMTAILLILHYFLSTTIIAILFAADVVDKLKKAKEEARKI